MALRAFAAQHGTADILGDIVASKDPTTYTILAEDGAALVGLIIAAAGIFFSEILKTPVLDGLASLLIGVLLATVATFLIGECRVLLIGEGVDPTTEKEIRKIASEDPLDESVPLTMHLGPENALLALDVQFRSTASASDVAHAIDRIKSTIRAMFPDLKRIYVEAETGSKHLENEKPGESGRRPVRNASRSRPAGRPQTA